MLLMKTGINLGLCRKCNHAKQAEVVKKEIKAQGRAVPQSRIIVSCREIVLRLWGEHECSLRTMPRFMKTSMRLTSLRLGIIALAAAASRRPRLPFWLQINVENMQAVYHHQGRIKLKSWLLSASAWKSLTSDNTNNQIAVTPSTWKSFY